MTMATQTIALRKRPASPRKVVRLTFSYGLLILVTLLISVPIIWLLVTSIKTDVEYNAWPIQFLPKVAQWANYAVVFAAKHHIFRYARNSLFLAMTFTTLTIITSSLGGFAFSRFQDVPGRNKLFSIVIALLIIPGLVTVIPQFIIFSRLGLTNTYWPWILWGLGASAYYIFMFRQFFLAFPKELEDAAEVDGCNPFRIYLQIFLPNAKPVLATAFIQGFSGVWGDWYNPVIYLSSENTTLAIKIATGYINPQGHIYVTITLAACVVYILPLILMFFLGQKHILRGVVTSGIKG
jgi:ABC-type glycerol-3-phosphate transport system permease component